MGEKEGCLGWRSGLLGSGLLSRAEAALPGIAGVADFDDSTTGAPSRTTHSAKESAEMLCEFQDHAWKPLGPEDVVMDLGCGDGEMLFHLCTLAGCRGIGIELDQELCAAARERWVSGPTLLR